MPDKQSKLKTFFSLFLPSPLGMVFYFFLSIATIALNQLSGVKEYLRLPDNADVFRTAAKGADHLLNSVIGESRTNVLVVGAFWAIVGLGVYLFLRGVARYIAELDDDIEVRRYVWPKGADRSKPLRVTVERTLFRIAALIGLAAVVFGPLAAVLKGPILVDFLGENLVVQYSVWFLASMLIWHAVVVLLRLVLLRPRIVGEI